MHNPWRAALPLTLSCALALRSAQYGSRERGTAGGPAADRAWSELTSSMDRMHAAMSSVAPSGDADADFVRLMLPHHQAAVDMAKTELVEGKSPELRRLAQEIIADQQSEMDLMELWLKKHAPSSHAQGSGGDPIRLGGRR
jgi:uncharacterized protein (DUF305 family)